MRFNAAFTALVSSASLMGYAVAEEPEANPDATLAIEKPTFTVCDLQLTFLALKVLIVI